MVIVRTICKTKTDAEFQPLGRMYRSRQLPLIRALGNSASLERTTEGRRCRGGKIRTVTRPPRNLKGKHLTFLDCDGNTTKTEGICLFKRCVKLAKGREVRIVIAEGPPDNRRFVHITMHSNESITGVRTALPLEATGFLRTALQRESPEGIRF
jgi:hypothetical protein